MTEAKTKEPIDDEIDKFVVTLTEFTDDQREGMRNVLRYAYDKGRRAEWKRTHPDMPIWPVLVLLGGVVAFLALLTWLASIGALDWFYRLIGASQP